jgi:sterol desaturase/sphingolipid hydroxylase (fatty acid hydroxylase superfamily)
MIAIWFVSGAAAWSLAEYLLHRFNGHEARGKNRFSREHLRHHAVYEYFAPARYVAPPALALVGGALVLALGLRHGLALAGGFASAYTFYEIMHRRLHTRAPWNRYGRWARRHHLHHHFVDARVNHGVTSPLWDVVFGTYVRPGVTAVPPKLATRWLRAAPEAYAADYRIKS